MADLSIGQRVKSPGDFITRYVAGIKEGHRFAKESQEHADRMLTWAIGLMGAAILGSKEFLSDAPPDLRFLALLPWTVGIICAIGGRLLSRNMVFHDNGAYFDRVNSMELLQLMLDDDAGVRRRIDIIISGGDGLAEKEEKVSRRLRWVNVLYYATHVSLGAGIIAVVVVAYLALKGGSNWLLIWR